MQTTHSIYTTTGERKYLTVNERERFIAEAMKADLPTLALCLLLCLTGCRISEALGVMPIHVETGEGVVRFRTLKRRKGRVEWRHVPIPLKLIGLLQSLSNEPETPIFDFSRTTAWRRIKKLMLDAGIEGAQATAKGARHYFGVHADAKGIPQPVLQRWMGHTKLETTAIYRQAVGTEEQQLAERLCWVEINAGEPI